MERGTIAERLKQARLAAGHQTATQAARAYGWTISSYLGYENGDREPSKSTAERLAAAYHVSLDWLLTGRGKMTGGQAASVSIPVMGYIGAGAIIEPEFDQMPPEGLFTVDLPFGLPDDMIGFEVRGDSMLPRYDEGDVIVVWREQKRSIDAFFGEEAAVRTTDGRRYIKTVTRGSTKRLFTLLSFNAKAIENVGLDWIGEIYVTVRAGQLRRIRANEKASNRRRAVARGRSPASKLDLVNSETP